MGCFLCRSSKIYVNVKPIFVNEYFDLVAKKTKKILFTSATICGADQFCKDLGITKSYASSEIPSSFPVKNRLVGYKPVGKLNFKNKNQLLPSFVKSIDNIIDYHKNENGLIHSVSYDNANYIKENSKFKKQILIPNREEIMDIINVIKEKSEKERLIIVSPALTEGVDLIDNLSRFQIFIKVPFGFLGDVWVKTKLQQDSNWYARNAIVKIVQGAGRSIRSKDDYAYTYILDENFRRLATESRNLFPNWFFESIRKINV
ncbi:MAG: helicase C-terminal domain-containing protein [Nanoarchaeota archaeon]